MLDLVINTETARMLGMTVSSRLLARADQLNPPHLADIPTAPANVRFRG